MENALYVILGWILGLFSPQIIESMQKPSRRIELRQSLFIELEELRHKLAFVAFDLARRTGMLNREFLQWLEPIARSRKHINLNDPSADILKSWLQAPKEGLETFFQSLQEPEVAPGLKKYTLPLLTSHIPSLSLFSLEFQRLALDIRARLEMLNEEIDTAWFHYTKTFDSSLSKNDQAIVRNNLVSSHRSMMLMCREIVDRISDILKRDN